MYLTQLWIPNLPKLWMMMRLQRIFRPFDFSQVHVQVLDPKKPDPKRLQHPMSKCNHPTIVPMTHETMIESKMAKRRNRKSKLVYGKDRLLEERWNHLTIAQNQAWRRMILNQ